MRRTLALLVGLAVPGLFVAVHGCGGSTSKKSVDSAGAGGMVAGDAGPWGSGGSAGTGLGGTGGTGVASTIRTPEEFCRQYGQVVADVSVNCMGASRSDADLLFSLPLICQRFTAAVQAGRIVFDPSHADRCIAYLRTEACDGTYSGTAADAAECGTVAAPQVPMGGECRNLYLLSFQECASTADAPVKCQSGNDHCAGTCVAASLPKPKAAVDQPCDRSGGTSCNDSLFCDTSGTDATASGICRPQKTSGPCLSSDACVPPYHCVGATGTMTCQKIKLIGEACTPGLRECTTLFGYCGDDGKCTDHSAILGEPCGTLPSGERVGCTATSGTQAEGAYCDAAIGSTTLGTCRAKLPAGSACDPSAGFVCDGNGGLCDPSAKTCSVCPL